MRYDKLRAALSLHFSVETLNEITRIGHEMLDSDEPIRHPIAIYTLTATAQKVALLCDGEGVGDRAMDAIEAHLKPKMLAVLDAADSDPNALISELDALARAYIDAQPLLRFNGT